MFYSQYILAKRGPLGTIWIAAHLDRRLRKQQITETDIAEAVRESPTCNSSSLCQNYSRRGGCASGGGRRVNATPARGFGTFTARLDAHGRPVHVVVPLTPRRPTPSAPEPRAFPSTGFLALNDCQKISKSFPRPTIS